MKRLKRLISEAGGDTQSLQVFKKLLDQNYKSPPAKAQAMATLATMVLGRDVTLLIKALSSPPPLPTATLPEPLN